jgi:hypothetical protein
VGLSTVGLGVAAGLVGLATGGLGAVAGYALYGGAAGLIGGTLGDLALTTTTSSRTTRDSGSPIYDLVEPVPRLRRNLLGLKRHVDLLFKRFTQYGFKYNAMQTSAARLAGYTRGSSSAEMVKPQDREGSCQAYAATFAGVLTKFGIEAEADFVKGEQVGKLFVAKVDRFIDPAVKGNLFLDDVLLKGYYVFSSHTATWVKDLNLFYDPMAVTAYPSFDRFVECELKVADDDKYLYKICGAFRTLGYREQDYQVRVNPKPKNPIPGNFSRYDLIRVKSD